jgi:hypothetical protein
MAAAIITRKGGSGCLVVDGVEDMGFRREREGIIVTGSDGCLLWNDRWCGGEVLADGFL